MSIEELYSLFRSSNGVETDTRKIGPGSIFFALRGDRFDGNQFAKDAIRKGADWAVIDDPAVAGDRTILVEDSLATLQMLAKFHRQHLSIPVLAITGSNGKTTTKELIHAVLSSTLRTYTTQGNLNNHIGVPLTLLKIKDDAEIAVIEMGANHLREIASYCAYALPTHGLITNCGKAHLEGFGGVEGVKKGKGELYDHLRANGGTAFTMWDYDYLREMSAGIATVIRYGTHDAGIEGTVIASEPYLEVTMTRGVQGTIRTNLVGDYNLPNVLAAAAVGNHFGVTDDVIRQAIEGYHPSNSRSQLIEKGTNRIILDAYNANPSSMKLAIENFSRMPGSEKILILGAMAELGEDSLKEHQSIIDLIGKYQWKEVALTGGDFLKLTHPYHSFKDASETAKWFREQHFSGVQILLKGSRSSQMEKVLE